MIESRFSETQFGFGREEYKKNLRAAMQLLFCGIFSGYRAPFLRLPGKIATSGETVAKKKSVVTFREREIASEKK